MSQQIIPQIPFAPAQPTTHYLPADSAVFGCGLEAKYGTAAEYAPDANCAHCLIVMNAEQA